jgi:hypothetical protein
VAEPADPIPDPIPTITLVDAARVLDPYFNGDAYRIADHVRKILTLGVPLFNGGRSIHPNCFPLGMVGVVGQHDPYDGKAYLEIRPLKNLDRWFWGATMCTLGRAAFEANLPSAAKPQSTPPSPPSPPRKSPPLPPLPKSVAKKLRHGPKIDRVYPALQMKFPPHGKTPKSLSVKQCARELSPLWEADRGRRRPDPSEEVIRVAMNLLGRTAG